MLAVTDGNQVNLQLAVAGEECIQKEESGGIKCFCFP